MKVPLLHALCVCHKSLSCSMNLPLSFKTALQFTCMLKYCSVCNKGHLPIALSCEQAEVKAYLFSYVGMRKQEIDSVNHWRALRVTKKHFFP